MEEGRPQKYAFSIERHDAKLTFSRSDILKTTTVTPIFLLHFLIDGVKIYNIGKYE